MAMLFFYTALVCIIDIGKLETKSLAKDIVPILSDTCQRKEQDDGEFLHSVRNKIMLS